MSFTAGSKIVAFVAIPDDFGALAEQDTITESQISDLAASVSQAEAEAGTQVAIRRWSPLRVNQAIQALAPGGGGGETNTGANVATNGIGVFDGKVGVQLQFRGIASLTTAGLTVTLDDAQNDIDLALIYASQAEAEAGTDNGKLMTALRVAQAIAAQGTGGGAPTNAQYLVLAAHGTLTVERVLTPDQSLAGVDDGAGAPYHVRLVNDSATPGTNKVYGTDGAGVRGWKDDPAGGSAVAIEDEGTQIIATLARLNFTGTGVTVSDAGSNEATVTIPGEIVAADITDATGVGLGLLTAADAAAQRALLGVDRSFDPVETTATSITISDAVAEQDLISTAVGAVTVTLGNATSDNKAGAITEGTQIITVVVATDVQYYLEGDDYTAAGRTASFEVRGGITWEVIRIDSGNRRYLIKGGTNHEQNLRDQVVSRAELKDYAETRTTPSSSAGVLTLNMENSNTFEVTLTQNVTTLTLSNPPATGKVGTIFLILKQDATGSRTFAWPAAIMWPGGTAPTISSAANAIDVYTLVTPNAGATWYGFIGGQDFS